jgi:hypothetical protein
MFYEVQVPDVKPGEKKVSAMVVLNPPESRRLLAKATVALPEVQNAMKKGMIIIGRGVTNAYVTEELLKTTVNPKGGLTLGMIANGFTNSNASPPVCTWHVIQNGKVLENADSNAGIYASGIKGGTIGMCWPIVTPRGSHLIQVIGLEKLIPSVHEAAQHSGIYYFKWSMGLPGRIMPVTSSKVVTEIQAFAVLAGVKAYHIASGGIAGSEGAVALTLEGEEKKVEKAFELAKSVKGEPPVVTSDQVKVSSPADYGYDAMAQHATTGG